LSYLEILALGWFMGVVSKFLILIHGYHHRILFLSPTIIVQTDHIKKYFIISWKCWWCGNNYTLKYTGFCNQNLSGRLLGACRTWQEPWIEFWRKLWRKIYTLPWLPHAHETAICSFLKTHSIQEFLKWRTLPNFIQQLKQVTSSNKRFGRNYVSKEGLVDTKFKNSVGSKRTIVMTPTRLRKATLVFVHCFLLSQARVRSELYICVFSLHDNMYDKVPKDEVFLEGGGEGRGNGYSSLSPSDSFLQLLLGHVTLVVFTRTLCEPVEWADLDYLDIINVSLLHQLHPHWTVLRFSYSCEILARSLKHVFCIRMSIFRAMNNGR
jgi:hypothetical protein